MLISTKGRYALRVMLELAGAREGEYLPLSGIAERQEISEKYLESIIVLLSKSGLVDGLRGKGGGYRLNRKPEEYTVGEILRTAEGSLAPVSCLVGDSVKDCPRSDFCRTLPMWEGLAELINDYFDKITLSDLLCGDGKPEK